MERDKIFNCPVDATLSVIGGKYKPIILHHLIERTLRFGELRRIIPQASHKVLTQQLRELESDGIIHREVYLVVPPKTEYSLTPLGRTLIPIIAAMCDWGRDHMNEFIKNPP
ncbi:MAG: helix-turn-helix transcriptional regulator [Selenomonadaceae bacterium]|nr:helix-turn-helix transcriptional regulator [Selenomonadaceae bacterium]